MKKKKLILPVILLGLLFLGGKGWWNSNFSPVSSDTANKSFIVTKGQSVDEIAENLKKENLIKSPFFFKLYLKQSGLDSKLQEGTFKLTPSKSSKEIAEILTQVPNDAWVTLLEGWRVEEMAEELSKKMGISSSEFIKKAKKHEGYLFPDTYLFPKEITIDGIVQVLRDNFDKKYTPELRAKIKAKGLSPEEGVILASIVEREGRSPEVRTEIAGILLKRLNINMGLNVDAAIQYSIGYQKNEKSWWKRHLTRDDLKFDSPYNTYLYRGLPPTSISNPSLTSLEAVANADPKTPYLYYYHDSKGNSHYGKTLDEHNENVANNP